MTEACASGDHQHCEVHEWEEPCDCDCHCRRGEIRITIEVEGEPD